MDSFLPENFLILVVDDLSQNLQVVGAILDEQGYGTTFAINGQQALERVQTITPDLILLDLMMPEMDGLEVCERLKNNPTFAEIPIIFLTASHETNHVLQAFERGAVDYVTKPFNAYELLARVRTHLELKHTRDQLKKTLANLVEARDTAVKATQIKSLFLANMSHEIRTPMNAVLGMTELLLNTQLNQEQQDFLQTLRSSGEYLLTIINDILDFSKLEAGQVHLDIHEFDLHQLVIELQSFFIPQAAHKNLKITQVVPPNIPQFVMGDMTRLRQVLTNLISNALKFTQQGQITIIVTDVTPAPSPNTPIHLKFAIQDTGIGIPPEGQAKLFESFSQVETSTTRQYGGTGLGLAICKQLVYLMRGEIGVDSTVNQGSTFWFKVPLERGILQHSEAQPQPTEWTPPVTTVLPPPPQTLPESIKLLLVEDTPINQKVILHQLKLLGYHADCVNNGQEALHKLETYHYDLIFMDCQMPILDGYETTQQFRRQQQPHQPSTIIVGLTAYAMEGDREKCLEAGMDDYLSKPVSIPSLSVMLHKWLSQSAANVSAHPSLINWERLHEFTGANTALEIELLHDFVSETQLSLQEARIALAQEDIVTLAHKLHQIKGSSANIGIRMMPDIAAKLENQVRQQQLGEANKLLKQLEQLLTQVQNSLSTCS